MSTKPGEGKESPQQQQQGGQQQQQQSGEGQQYGEGNYKATRDYNRGLKEHVEHHDIEKEARDAAPRNAAEEKEMEDAERIARGRSKAGNESPDAPENQDDVTK
ncbi:MAG: hypothetical protein H7Y14_11485 [Burkholderiales bacterium]|nr:hypothetical protein [Burkholderiales bacterium]